MFQYTDTTLTPSRIRNIKGTHEDEYAQWRYTKTKTNTNPNLVDKSTVYAFSLRFH